MYRGSDLGGIIAGYGHGDMMIYIYMHFSKIKTCCSSSIQAVLINRGEEWRVFGLCDLSVLWAEVRWGKSLSPPPAEEAGSTPAALSSPSYYIHMHTLDSADNSSTTQVTPLWRTGRKRGSRKDHSFCGRLEMFKQAALPLPYLKNNESVCVCMYVCFSWDSGKRPVLNPLTV